jgi:hypothetical protein
MRAVVKPYFLHPQRHLDVAVAGHTPPANAELLVLRAKT